MDWKDSKQVEQYVRNRFDASALDKVTSLFALNRLLISSVPKASHEAHAEFGSAVVLSEYGKEVIAKIGNARSEYSLGEIGAAALSVFFHRDLLVDIEKSDIELLVSRIDTDLREGSLRLPNRFGRNLYDRFNDLPGNARVDHLEPSLVDALIENAEQGVYQVGKYVFGPLGILESKDQRYLPPTRLVPLWHCDDPGCQHIHQVRLERHKGGFHSLAKLITRTLEKFEGPSSVWRSAVSKLYRGDSLPGGSTRGRAFFDITTLVAEAVPGAEGKTFFSHVLVSALGKELRSALNLKPGGKWLAQGSEDVVANRLTEGQRQQLLMILDGKQIVQALDATELRRAKSRAPSLSNYDLASTLSIFGVRADHPEPVLFLSSIVEDEYRKANQLDELEWRCSKGIVGESSLTPLEYLQHRSGRDAVANLILSSRPIALAVANRIWMDIDRTEPEDQTINRFLWKLGFNPARYDLRYERLRAQLQSFREEVFRIGFVINADDRDNLRSKGVTVFVSVEHLLEEIISYNVWFLASDHVNETKFQYRAEDAICKVADVLGDTYEFDGREVTWSRNGRNVLGTLLVYARLAADWMAKLSKADKALLLKTADDLPHYIDYDARQFRFYIDLCGLTHRGQPLTSTRARSAR
jgi:hypothetical protein